MKPLYIFDLDGTLALIEHRRHFVENRANRWKEFFAACVDDAPNTPVIEVLLSLLWNESDVLIFSGRSDEVRKETEDWLDKHVTHGLALRMRKKGDYTPDDVLKRQWLDELSPADRHRLVAVFDDRNRVVKMWRAAGVPCFQVADGEF